MFGEQTILPINDGLNALPLGQTGSLIVDDARRQNNAHAYEF